jgi:hypothetical protein
MSNQTNTLTSLNTLQQTLAARNPRGLPLDPEAAASALLGRLAGGEFLATAESFAALRESNLALLGSSPEGIREALARQTTLLDALFLHLSARALAASGTEAQARLIHAAVGCQQASLRTLVALGASVPGGEA